MSVIPRLLAAVAFLALLGVAPQALAARTLPALQDDRELEALVGKWGEAMRRRLDEQRRQREAMAAKGVPQPLPSPMAAAPASAAAASESVTNVQHAGVDEGGIVKVHGDHLVVLRRGRLFTASLAGNSLVPVDMVDAYAPGVDPRGAWYDEMLLWRDTVVVIGYSYARGGTEVGLFDISPSGRLTYRATYHLRSNDYYSSRNYASRLIGSKLVFYTPLRLNPLAPDWKSTLPGMRRWTGPATPADFRRIAPATRIHRTDDELDVFAGIALHTVSICDLAKPELDCESTAVLGRPGRVFYVSPAAVYVWTTAWRNQPAEGPASAVFRIPLDGSAPSALKTSGSPVDQLSFLEGSDGMLNVLVRAQGMGDGMWAGEVRGGDLALLRVPVDRFSDGRESAPPDAYRALPSARDGALQNRYVGDVLLYGAGAGWRGAGGPSNGAVHAVRVTDAGKAYTVELPHRVDRIEAMGANAVIVGGSGPDLYFTSLRLTGVPVEAGRYLRRNAAQGETRSHGFFYKPDDAFDGLVGLPILSGGQSAAGQLVKPAAAVLFLRNRSLGLSELGALESRASAPQDDACRASCVDWYGNSRPLFLRNRVFALMGYELVEGRLAADGLSERRRVDLLRDRAAIAR